MSLTGNVGEWSEIYVLLKILAEGSLDLGNDFPGQSRNRSFNVLGVRRWVDSSTAIEIEIDHETKSVIIENSEIISQYELAKAAEILLAKIQQVGPSFQIEELERLLARLRVHRLKASSGEKSDIELDVQDPYLRVRQSLKFSIKSMLGSPATLMNSSRSTNLIFLVEGDNRKIETLRLFDGQPGKLIRELKKKNLDLNFVRCANSTFEENLTLIDSQMPKVLASMYVEYFSGEAKLLVDAVTQLTENNPLYLGGTNNLDFYRNKVQDLLAGVALGMVPSKPWDGNYLANGGYIIVQPKGEVICLHSFERDSFRSYLLNSTKFDTPSTSRNQYGSVRETGDLRHPFGLELNAQIRFIH